MTQSVFEGVMEALEEAIAYSEGRPAPGVRVHAVEVVTVDVKALRTKLGMSQDAFARAFAFKKGTVAQWEQGRRTPRGPERVLLRVIEREPDAVRRALAE